MSEREGGGMKKDRLLQIYARLKKEHEGAPVADVAESEGDFFHSVDVRRLFHRLGLVSDSAANEKTVEEINRAVAETRCC